LTPRDNWPDSQDPGSIDKYAIVQEGRAGKLVVRGITSPMSPPAPYGKKRTRFGFFCIYIYALEILKYKELSGALLLQTFNVQIRNVSAINSFSQQILKLLRYCAILLISVRLRHSI